MDQSSNLLCDRDRDIVWFAVASYAGLVCSENVDRTVHGFWELEDDTIDVLFLGTSLIEQGFSPMKLYEDLGICSYSMASASQPILLSYHILEEVFETQSPSLVIYGVTPIGFELFHEGDYSWRFQLDNTKLSKIKLEMAKDYEGRVDVGDRWNAIFPIFKFHYRWNELNSRDFEWVNYADYYTAGYYVQNGTCVSTLSREDVDYEVDYMLAMGPGKQVTIEDGRDSEEKITSDVYSLELFLESVDKNVDELLKIKELCEENGAELLLVMTPARTDPALVSYTWTKPKYLRIKTVAEDLGLRYVDLNYDADPNINFATDSWDSYHLNIRGAEKDTEFLESYLLQNYDLARDNMNQLYDDNLADYRKVRSVAYLQSETNFDEYLKRLLEGKEGQTILIAACDDYITSLNEAEFSLLDQLGLQLISQGNFRYSYAAVIENGNVRYESVSDRRIEHTIELNDTEIELTSSGWHTTPVASIVIDGSELAMGERGLNFVVIDNETGLVLDSVSFDTWQESKPCMRNSSNANTYLRNYESAVCFG